MNFNSPVFIFLFLPVFLIVFWAFRRQFNTYYLILISLIYYLWIDAPNFSFILIISLINFLLGKYLQKNSNKSILILSIFLNLIFLVLFKIYAQEYDFEEILASTLSFLPTNMPIGYSFISFTSIAYLIDSHKKKIVRHTGLKHYLLYQLFFSKITSGPIIRFTNLEKSFPKSFSLSNTANGLRRFLIGFIKKVLIADILGVVVDQVFEIEPANIPFRTAWIAIIFYALQVYYDFSGYTDMALGMGMTFGIKLPENFNYPYISKSIGDFWRRWHITLSIWFRDYVFYPFERLRKTKFNTLPQATSIMIVFLLTGLWHGLSLNFLVWGLIHGVMISVENSSIGKRIKKYPFAVQHIYFLLIINISWVFFRSPNFDFAIEFIGRLFTLGEPYAPLPIHLLQPIESFTWLMFIIAVLFSAPYIKNFIGEKLGPQLLNKQLLLIGKDFVLLALFSLAILFIFENTFSSFLYAQF